MRNVLLLIAVIVYALVGYLVVGRIGAYIERNYKAYEYENEEEHETHKQDI